MGWPFPRRTPTSVCGTGTGRGRTPIDTRLTPEISRKPSSGRLVRVSIEGDCSSAFKPAMVGLSAATGTARAHSLLCGSELQLKADTQNVIDFSAGSFRSDGMGHTIPFGGADWGRRFLRRGVLRRRVRHRCCTGDERTTDQSAVLQDAECGVTRRLRDTDLSQGGDWGSLTANEWANMFYKGQYRA